MARTATVRTRTLRADAMTTGMYRVATVPGDGVGPEVVAAARTVVDAAGARFGFEVTWDEVLAGGAAIDRFGVAIRPEDVERCRDSDAVLLGAVGGPRWDDPTAAVRPEQALLGLRAALGLFANLRPVRPHPALVAASPLREDRLRGVDLLIVRELTGGVYFGERTEATGAAGERAARDTMPYSDAEIGRVVRLAFELARDRRRKVTSVDKANVLATSRLWRRVADEVGAAFPDVELEHRLVDSCAMLLVTRPSAFDVVVTENLFGDILSDEAAVLTGSLGMLPSASLGERRTAHGTHGLYEPIHGSAPDIAGQGRANPLGTILSAAMLLRWSLGETGAAEAIEAAVDAAVADGARTPDIGGEATTDEVTAAVVQRLPVPATATLAGSGR
jgi:3-isopropylmalate dehydrogenase